MVLFLLSEADPVRVDVLNATYEEQRPRRTRRGGKNVRDALAENKKKE